MSEPPEIEYRGHFIAVRSESDGQRWRPKAVVSIFQRGRLRQQTVKAPDRVLLESEEAAETYALAIAKKWIDEQQGWTDEHS